MLALSLAIKSLLPHNPAQLDAVSRPHLLQCGLGDASSSIHQSGIDIGGTQLPPQAIQMLSGSQQNTRTESA